MNIRTLPSLDTMERIPQAQISEKLDEIFERIDKENIGFVITEDGKDKYVLCPFDWFDFSLDEGFGRTVNSAIRNELNHPSENTEAVQCFVRNHYGSFDLRTITTAVEDIERAINPPLKTAVDSERWTTIQRLLSDRLSEIKGAQKSQNLPLK